MRVWAGDERARGRVRDGGGACRCQSECTRATILVRSRTRARDGDGVFRGWVLFKNRTAILRREKGAGAGANCEVVGRCRSD